MPARTSPLKREVDRARDLLGQIHHPVAKPLSFGAAMKTTAALVAMASFGLAGLAVGDTTPIDSAAPRSAIDIRVGRNAKSGRVEIYGSVGSRASVRRDKDLVVIRLPGQQKPDLGDIRANLPVGVTGVDLRSDARASEIVLKVAEGYDARFGRSDGAVYVQFDADSKPDAKTIGVNLQDLMKPAEKAGESASSQAANQANISKAANVPVVALQVEAIDGGKDIAFAFEGPVAAAVFRRGDSVWVVFDSEVDLRLPPELKDGMTVQDAQWTRNDGFTALRMKAPGVALVTAAGDGLTWRVRLGGRSLATRSSEVIVTRDDTAGAGSLSVTMAGATRIAWIRDPGVGDRMAVITARAPIKSLSAGRNMIEASLASTAQGVVVTQMTPDVKVELAGDLVHIWRPGGLTLSAVSAIAEPKDGGLEYRAARYPSLINAEWSETPSEGFLARYNALQARAADETQQGATAPSKARLAMARFLIGQGMTFEALGLLDMLVRQNPNALVDPQVRGLRVAAKMMSGRYRDAAGDLSAPQMLVDPSARLWQGYADYMAGNYADAVRAFKAGAKAMDAFPPQWRATLGAAYAYSAMQEKDMDMAQVMIRYAVSQDVPPLDKLAAYLVNAQIIEASGDKARALNVYRAVAKASDDAISTPARVRAAMLAFELKQAKPEETLATLDSLRFRWRGDKTEMEIVGNMGQIYLSMGHYREAMQVLRTGGQQFANSPEGLKISNALNQTFRALFLGGQADGLQPVEALGLFYDFQELTPQGADGDEMVRKLVRRLVDVDLLDQASALLEHQVNERLDGVAKSAVAADLAAIYLMDRNPQKALQTLWNTRTTLLPKSIMAERRVLEARALTELNEPDKALDVLGSDASADADDVRADIYWRQQSWAKAGAVLERRLGERYKAEGPLAAGDEGRLIRAGIAYSLMKDTAGLKRLSERWGKFIDTASSPDALRVALAPLDGGDVSAKDFASAATATDTFTGWVGGMKKRFRDKDNATGKKPAAPAAKTA
ncbi:tetratricopeptide repeat family protein [Asticcacaulis biprosthecium C19]|uniref:Tetratricopeptide repeat family protein n=1 Tax=Asticcacaulis biprosthecium C19 TaxID=715226 RepID=F4QPD1_9CAUL|nr:tetratricopeptide repeat protein [Asticcacaulis biprosthecium]EGF91189.1 tetratricopeptide repeat family protein [Asticcacaulis biprosthecium C19]